MLPWVGKLLAFIGVCRHFKTNKYNFYIWFISLVSVAKGKLTIMAESLDSLRLIELIFKIHWPQSGTWGQKNVMEINAPH